MMAYAMQTKLYEGRLPSTGRGVKRTYHPDVLHSKPQKLFKKNLQPVDKITSCPKERHGRLVSSGAPGMLGFLNGLWRRCSEQPDIADRPHYILTNSSYDRTLHMTYCWKKRSWQVSSDLSASPAYIYATATSNSLHPNTVMKHSWAVLDVIAGFSPCHSFEVNCLGPNTPEEPFLIEELGRDFFVCAQPRKWVVWFECPRTRQILHSGAKRHAGRNAGHRYCHLCNSCFSANNFKSQHLRKHLLHIDEMKAILAQSSPAPQVLLETPVNVNGIGRDASFQMLKPPIPRAHKLSDDCSETTDESCSILDADDLLLSDLILDEADLFLIQKVGEHLLQEF